MDADDKDDLLIVKASATLLSDLETALPKILWKQQPGQLRQIHRYVRWRSLEHVVSLIEPFQSEPQLLDAKLRHLIPPLVDAYLEFLQHYVDVPYRQGHVCLDEAICRLLYTFCKVRGEKIIAGFLNNEPRYLDLILSSYESALSRKARSTNHWQILYILVLWLWHLSLAPFDLSTVSSTIRLDALPDLGFAVPDTCSAVVLHLLSLATSSLASLTREHQAAAKLLVRLVNRPDIQLLKLHNTLIPHACKTIANGLQHRQVDQSTVGYLRFLVGLVSTSSQSLDTYFLPAIWTTSSTLYDRLFTETGDSSAVNRKLLLKLLRSTAVHCLTSSTEAVTAFAEEYGVIEDIIDKLLQIQSDRDTQVRFAAAKAVGAIISRLDKELASEVISAIVESYNLNSTEDSLDFSLQDPQLWHGLTLSLAHCLFGRSVSADQLPSVIRALLPALNFEKQAVTGNSLGTNVRDAACFAIWSMSRRYTTAELTAVDISSLQLGTATAHGLNLIQFIAIQLMVAACLDPSGNVRRGCSAALQELIGRHPDQVHEGITLIQIIDYQAVGLRRRAMIDLVVRTSLLDDVYWMAYLSELQGWRGIGSPDILSRQAAAESIGQLYSLKSIDHLQDTQFALSNLVRRFGEHAAESRHGALLALCEVADQKLTISEQSQAQVEGLSAILDSLLGSSEYISQLDLNIRAVRADLPSAMARYCTTAFTLLALDLTDDGPRTSMFSKAASLTKIVDKLLARSDEPLLRLIPPLVYAIISLKDAPNSYPAILKMQDVLHDLAIDGKRSVLHGACRAFALAAAVSRASSFELDPQQILGSITNLMISDVIEWRVIALRASAIILSDPAITTDLLDKILPDITQAVLKGLTDYTITERGDVGSLARLKALLCVQQMWRMQFHVQSTIDSEALRSSVIRLALEKLDRVRLQAWQVLLVEKQGTNTATTTATDPTIDDVSSQGYFAGMLERLNNPSLAEFERTAILRGLSSSAGSGAEHLLQKSRAAFVNVIQQGGAPTAKVILTAISEMVHESITIGCDPEPALELLAFVLDNVPIQQMVGEDFKWRTLLSRVQKSHFKSTIQTRLMVALEVYRLLGTVKVIRTEVLKKLQNMVKTNPIVRVRYTAAETLWCLTGEAGLKLPDFSQSGRRNAVVLEWLQLPSLVA